MRLPTITRTFFAIALLTLTGGGAEAVPPAAGPFVKNLADEVLTIFNNPQITFPEREKRMSAIAARDFDLPYTARFVVGYAWRDASVQERQDFTAAYVVYIVHVYTVQFDRYHDVDFQVLSERAETPTQSVVSTQILRHDGRPPIKVDWRVVAAGDARKIVDVNIQGISQIVTLRDEFTALMQRDQGGIPMLVKRLKEKSQN